MRLDRFVHFDYFVFYDSCWLCKVYIGLCFRFLSVRCAVSCYSRVFAPFIPGCFISIFLPCHVYTYNASCLSIANSCFGPRPDNGAARIGSPAPQDQAWPANPFSRATGVGRSTQWSSKSGNICTKKNSDETRYLDLTFLNKFT